MTSENIFINGALEFDDRYYVPSSIYSALKFLFVVNSFIIYILHKEVPLQGFLLLKRINDSFFTLNFLLN